ncbi:MAG: radical SAM protein [Bacilli bacterium]|nr:radical SAM protein [Bacilli bacterium]
MKVFIADSYSCGVNSELYEIEFGLHEMPDCEFISKPEEADVIIFPGTCCCHEERILYLLNYISSILDRKKEGAKSYLTGCMTHEFIDDKKLSNVKGWLKKNIDVIVPSDKIIDLLKDLYYEQYKDVEYENGFAYSIDNNADIFLSRGCLNQCSFCKTSFLKMPLVSMDMAKIKECIDFVDENKAENLDLKGMNICQLGLDTTGQYLLPEVIEYVEKKENIKNVTLVGFAYADAIRSEFQYVLRKSKKVTNIVGSLESGDNRLLSLMHKGYYIESLLDFVHFINQEYKKMLDINIIAGFPTETLDEVKKTMMVLKELKDYLGLVNVCKYSDSTFVASHNLEQLPKEKIEEHARIYSKFLKHEGIPTVLI